MQIEILIDGEKKTFITSQVSMLARRKFLEIQVREDEILEKQATLTAKEQIELENEMIHILVDTVFKNQFTFDQLLDGVTEEYYDEKMAEAIFGTPKESEEGNTPGK